MRVLHVAAEIFPFVKVGGLGDVIGALPQAQMSLGIHARVFLPAYPALKVAIPDLKSVCVIPDLLGHGPAAILLGKSPAGVPIYLLDAPDFFDRSGGPYDELGDSHLRFGAFSYAAAWLARHGDEHGWKPEILHCHDWQTALAPAYLAAWEDATKTVMGVHNLAYQGVYEVGVLASLWLPESFLRLDGLEFHGALNFLKGGLQFASRIATVSPTYAEEIQRPQYGEGLDPLLRHRSSDLVGILNGVDSTIWNPASSIYTHMHYDSKHRSGKMVCKNMLQREMCLEEVPNEPIFSAVCRMAPQKGLDMLLSNVDHLVNQGGQLIVLGSGDPILEKGFLAAAERHPGRVAVRIGYDEGMAHRILSGADALVMPSRHEPCGLTQMYALTYGALPLVRSTGGLIDTVVDATPENLEEGRATGFHFDKADGLELGNTISRACDFYFHRQKDWIRMQQTAMRQDFSWRHSAKQYLELYQSVD